MRRTLWSKPGSRTRRMLGLLVLALSAPLVAARSQAGSVSGVVSDSSSGRPLSDAVVRVQGGNQATRTTARGQFTLSGLTGTTVTLSVTRLGQKPVTRTLNVGATDVSIALEKSVLRLDEMVVTGQAGDTQAVAIINARRAQLQLPAYTGPTDAASIQALVLDERNRELFMEGGQRFNDLLRKKIAWKVGNDQNGVPYGATTCMPLPKSERIAAGG